jgi:hypothetical protein
VEAHLPNILPAIEKLMINNISSTAKLISVLLLGFLNLNLSDIVYLLDFDAPILPVNLLKNST